MNETYLESPKLLTKFTESPPPTIEVAPYLVLFTILFKSSVLPLLNSGT